MTDRSKKILFAAFFIVVSAGMGYIVYYMLFRQAAPVPVTNEQTPGYGGTLPQAGTGTTTAIAPTQPGQLPPSTGGLPTTQPTGAGQLTPSGTRVLNPGVSQAVSPSPDGNGARFYNPEDGRFYHVLPDGTIKALGDKQFYNVENVNWGNTTDQAILAFPNGSKIFYNFESGEQVNLPNHWQDFQFSPNDTEVAAKSIGTDPDNRFLITSNPDGTEAKAIEALGDNADKVHIDWNPSSQILGYAFTGDPQSGNQQQVLFIGKNHENFKSIVAPGQGFVGNWSPTGKQILFSTWDPSNDNKPMLWLSSGDPTTMGANRKSLSLSTWADKCVWANDTQLFCAVPQNLPANAGLLRSQFATLPDDIYHIDLAIGSAVKINADDQNHPVRNPVVDKSMSKFIFSDAQTGTLYSYDIK